MLKSLAEGLSAPWVGKVRIEDFERNNPKRTLESLINRLTAAILIAASHQEDELGSGGEMALIAVNRLRYVQDGDYWMVYDKDTKCWGAEKEMGSQNFAKVALLNRQTEIRPDQKLYSANVTQTRAMAKEHLAIVPEAFDSFPTIVNTPSGAYDLESGKLFEQVPSMLLTKCTTAPFGSKPGPIWLNHIKMLTHGNEQAAVTLQIAAGLSLYGGTDKPQKLVFLRGKGRNGKGIFLQAINNTLGDYVTVVNRGIFTEKDDAIPHEILQLKGARAAFCAEAPRAQLNVATVNNLTGGDALKGRRLHANYTSSFKPTFLPMWILGNESLKLDSNKNDALYERFIFIDVGASIPPEKRDDQIGLKLNSPEERAGIMAWLLEGWKMFLDNGRKIPQTSEGLAMIAVSRSDGDLWSKFRREGHIELDPDSSCVLEVLQDRFRSFCAAHDAAYFDPKFSIAEAVGWENMVTDESTGVIVRGIKLNTVEQATGFNSLLRRN